MAKVKKFKITVSEKGFDSKEEAIQEVVYVSAYAKVKAERIAILVVADEWSEKTSNLEVTATEQMKPDERLDFKNFVPLVGIQIDGFGDPDNDNVNRQ